MNNTNFYSGFKQYYLHQITRPMFLKMYNDCPIMGIAESRCNVENLDFEYIDSWVKTLEESKEVLDATILFSINGYEEDNREIYEIPEVRTYVNKLLERHPHFLIFFRPEDMAWFMLCATVKMEIAPVVVNAKQAKLTVDTLKYKRIINRTIMSSLKVGYLTDEYMNNFTTKILDHLV